MHPAQTRKTSPLINCRGLSDPFFFAFDVLERGRTLLCHAVIFTSFEALAEGNDNPIKLCTMKDDPRMIPFVAFCIDNYGAKAKLLLEQEIQSLTDDIGRLERKLSDLRKQINETKKTHERTTNGKSSTC